MTRLDKFLSEAGVATRRELREIIRAGRVRVDGTVIRDYAYKLDESQAQVLLDGVQVEAAGRIVLMMNKPAGYITATGDARKATVMELLPEQYRNRQLKPVGRLDKETEGLLLFTNDGDLLHRVVSPRHAVWKTYYAEHEGIVTQADIDAFAAGLRLRDGTVCLPAELIEQEVGKSLIRVQEGKYHQVRRMMSARGMFVTYLKRIQEGNLKLGNLPTGEVRILTDEEIAAI